MALFGGASFPSDPITLRPRPSPDILQNPDFVRVNNPRKLLKLPHPIELFLQFYRALLPSELVFGR